MTHEELAERLLTPLWRGIDPDYKRKYARSIWPQFEDNLRSAAYTAKLSTFLAKITTRLAVEIRGEDAESVAAVIQSGNDKVLLKMLRDETTLLVLLVRVANDERKAKVEAKKQTKKEAARADLSIRGDDEKSLFGES